MGGSKEGFLQEGKVTARRFQLGAEGCPATFLGAESRESIFADQTMEQEDKKASLPREGKRERNFHTKLIAGEKSRIV